MKTIIQQYYQSVGIIILALIVSIGVSRANVVIGTFNSASDVSAYSFGGWNGSTYGIATFSTNAPDYTNANGVTSSGSMQLQLTFQNPSQQGGAFVSSAPAVDVSEATYVEFDLMVDPASPVDPNGNVCYFQLVFNSPSFVNMEQFWLGPSGAAFTPGVWQHFKLAIPAGKLGTSESDFAIYPYENDYTSAQTPIFYIDNIVFDTPAANLPGPTIGISKPTEGLNVFNATAGLYDREEVMTVTNTVVSWTGQTYPISYSFTIAGFPNNSSSNAEAFMFLSPNPTAVENAPDWDLSNSVVAFVESAGPGSPAALTFQYKVNDWNDNAMLYGYAPYTNAPGSWDGFTSPWHESGSLGSITNPTPIGKWTVEFTSSTNVTLITPSGTSTNLVIPPYNIGTLAPAGSLMNVYLGEQANNTNVQNQAVVYANFSITGSSTPISDNFLADSTLNTNIWDNTESIVPDGVLVVPASSAYWINWTLPANSFSPEIAASLTNPLGWTMPASSTIVPMNASDWGLISTNDLPAGNAAFFRLIKLTYTQLQVLLPGETNAPNTLTGKIGTPTPVSISAGGGVALEPVTINACDATWHIVNTSGDSISLTSSDGTAITPSAAPLVNGTVQETMAFVTPGSPTVTATDNTSTSSITATSSSLTVNP